LKSGPVGPIFKMESREREGSMSIELSAAERELLASILEDELTEIRSELHHAQVHDYKESLKAREALVRGLLDRLRS
jgi:hypothetical protein